MIQLTRLNNHTLFVNSDLIKFVEKAPDTVLTLVNGEKIIVLESSDEVLAKVVAFRRSVLISRGAPFSPRPDAEVPSATDSDPTEF
jgi:flagellar protein FlbD